MESIRWEDNKLFLLDQRKLPHTTEYICCEHYQTVATAIRQLSVRGAPAIGVAAAYGLVLGLQHTGCRDTEELTAAAEQIAAELLATRPTAVNLKWALERMKKVLCRSQTLITIETEENDKILLNKDDKNCYNDNGIITESYQNFSEGYFENIKGFDESESLSDKFGNFSDAPLRALRDALLREAHLIMCEDIQTNKLIGSYGEKLIPDGAGILNHCNAGALATAGYGTSLGVIRAAVAVGKKITAYIDETRPLLQGARLTAWELMRENIPAYLITDNMAAALMATGRVQLVIVGADRIAANGDVANKIGTYGLAILAKEHGLPFYVAAPLSTVDYDTAEGKDIPIEERDSREVTHINEHPIAPEGIKVWNPAFDITPAKYISAIITEKGIVSAPYEKNLKF